LVITGWFACSLRRSKYATQRHKSLAAGMGRAGWLRKQCYIITACFIKPYSMQYGFG
jgi:hypothetical protein